MKTLLTLLLLALPAYCQFSNARSIWGRPIASTAPTDGYSIVWNASQGKFIYASGGGAATSLTGPINATSTITIPQWLEVIAGVCQNVTASTPFSLETSNAASALCITGSNTQVGATQFTSGKFVQGSFILPDDWLAVMTVEFRFLSETAASTGNVVWGFQYKCVANTAASIDQALASVQTATVAAGANNTTNLATLATPTISGCTAGQKLFYRLSLDSSTTAAGNEDLLSVRFKISRTITAL